MQTLESIKRKIETAGDLHSVVSTMKVLATINIRMFEKTVDSFLEYSSTIEAGVQMLLKNRPEDVELSQPLPNNRLLALIFGSGQGLAGQFNEQIAAYAAGQMDEMGIAPGDRTLLALGEHVAVRLAGIGQPAEEYYSIPGSIRGITRLAQEILIRIQTIRLQRGIEQIILFYHRPVSSSKYRAYRLPLLPVSQDWLNNLAAREWPTRMKPLYTMDWQRLFEALIRQDLYVSLNRAFMESLASENASRLMSMQAAEKNIQDRIEDLTHEFNQQRQNEITEELLDIVAGYEAITGEKGFEGLGNYPGAA